MEAVVRCLYPEAGIRNLMLVDSPEWLHVEIGSRQAGNVLQRTQEDRWPLTLKRVPDTSRGTYDGTLVLADENGGTHRVEITVSMEQPGEIAASTPSLFLGNDVQGRTQADFDVLFRTPAAEIHHVEVSCEEMGVTIDEHGKAVVTFLADGLTPGTPIREQIDIISEPGGDVVRVDVVGRVNDEK